MTTYAGDSAFWVDTETTTLREADHLLQSLAAELALPEGAFGCTHLVRGSGRGLCCRSRGRRRRLRGC